MLPADCVERIGASLVAQGARLTVAESCTGGGIAQALTDVAGASRWFDCGFVTYSNQAKQRLLGVDARVLDAHGAVSEAVVCAMAVGAARAVGADYALATSGIAGPGGGTTDKPVGTVWFAWHLPSGTLSACHRFDGDRVQVRQQAVALAVQHLWALMSRAV